MNAAQLEQWRALADEGGFFEGNAVILELIAEVERLQAQLDAVPVDAMRLLLWGDATQPGYANAVGTVGMWGRDELCIQGVARRHLAAPATA